jgi:plastocyanin
VHKLVCARYDAATVKMTGRILALFGTAAVLLVAPAAHAQDPVAATVLTATPESPAAGEVVRLAAPIGAASYAWDFDGDGTWDVEGAKAERDHRYAAGAYSATVRLTAADGTESVQKVALDVAPASVARDVDAAVVDDTPDDEPDLPLAQDDADDAVGAGDDGGTGEASSSDTPAPRTADRTVVAQTAATKTVTISDFEFAPGTITVNVGDTVKWTNDGPTAHTATADDDSFDTGILQEGESGTATFDTEGSFSYICTPHPFMKGTVEVGAAGSTGDDGSSGAGTSGTDDTLSEDPVDSGTTTDDGSGTTDSGSDSSLPTTGTTDLRIVGLVGFLLLFGGIALRRFARWV